MTTREETPILVTGGHRTSTTWVGRMLAANPRAAYISEPLNVLHRPGVLKAKVAHWYEYICAENELEYLDAFEDTLTYRYHLAAEILSLRSGHDLLRMGRDFAIFVRGGLQHRRPLLKDPFAVFSLAWFAERLGCRIVVTVRHPAAFASSLKRLGWSFDFRNLLDQPLLMRDRLEPFRSQIQSVAPDDVIAQAGLLWAMIYRSVQEECRRVDTVHIVRHEDLSLDPLPGYRSLYEQLGLDFSSDVERRILQSSSSENPAELSKKKVHSVKLDSRANLYNWKHRLTADEIRRIRRQTEEVAHGYYPEVEWE